MSAPITQKIEITEYKQPQLTILSTKTESVFYNEKCVCVATSTHDSKRHALSDNHGDWLVAALLVNNVFKWVTLYEYDYKLESGQHVYKRSSFLPEMVGKTDFLGAIEKIYKK
jgi:hypothetical protein